MSNRKGDADVSVKKQAMGTIQSTPAEMVLRWAQGNLAAASGIILKLWGSNADSLPPEARCAQVASNLQGAKQSCTGDLGNERSAESALPILLGCHAPTFPMKSLTVKGVPHSANS